ARLRPTAESEALDLVGVRGQADTMNAGRSVTLDITEQCEQARMPRALTTKDAARMKAQHLVDTAGERGKVELAGIGEIAGGERAGDWLALVPQFECELELAFIAVGRGPGMCC